MPIVERVPVNVTVFWIDLHTHDRSKGLDSTVSDHDTFSNSASSFVGEATIVRSI